MKHYNITIRGKVQGVFFRKYTVDKARELSLNGFICNKPDGSVYAEAEGDEETLSSFVEWCHKGSPFSKVTEVIAEEGVLQHFKGFEIRH